MSTTIAPPPAAATARTGYTLAGRAFEAVTERTFEHDIYVMRHAEAAGLTDLEALLREHRNDVERLSSAILFRVYDSGRLFEMLAGVLVEQGARWSPASAAEAAAFFATLTDEGDKEQLRTALVECVLAFFLIGVRSSGTSLSSLLERESRAETEALPPASEAAPTSETGAS